MSQAKALRLGNSITYDAGRVIAKAFSLPLDVVTEACGIVATRGAGKSYASAVLIEEAVGAKVQTVVVDVMGVYHGLRSSASGDGPGLPLYVLGGQYGDLPLDASAGAFIADLVVDSGHSFVLDLSDFSKARARTFVADFLERLYHRKARSSSSLLLVVDEADEFAPQKPRGDAIRSLGAMETVAKRGRSRGIGVVLITQRTQALNKDVLDLIETLLAMRQLAERSREAVKGWIADRELRDELGVIESLPSLPTGTAWVWSPLRGILSRVAVREIRTFDSYRTPKPGEATVEPATRVELDLDALGEKMRATVERAKANDPAELRRRVATLERQLAERPTEETERVVEREVEVSVVTDEDWARLETIFGVWNESERLVAYAERVERDIDGLYDRLKAVRSGQGVATTKPTVPQQPRRSPTAPTERRPSAPTENGGGPAVKAGARRILETLARHHPTRMTRAQLGTLARFKITGGTFQTYFRTLNRLDLLAVAADGTISLTDDGLAYVGHVPQAPHTTEETLAMWRGALKAGAREMLDVLVERYPGSLSRDELAEAVGMTASGGTFQTYLGTLRRNGLTEQTADGVRASESLFLGARA